MRLLKLYNKSKKSINKSSINSKYAISFKAYELLKRYVVKELVSSNKLDSAYPINTKLKVEEADLLIFFRQMSVMLKSGVPLSQGIELLAENVNNKKFGANLFDVSKRLGGGEELSSSLENYPRIFSPIIINNKNKTILDINDILLIVFELNIDEFKLDNLLIPLSAKSITKPVTEKNAVERNANLIPS